MNAPIPKTVRFTIEQYHHMGDVNILPMDVRTELLRGEIVHMSAKGIPHECCLTKLNRQLVVLLNERAVVRVQSPILVPPDSEPEPDFSIVKYRSDYYSSSHPHGSETILVIEISASSLFIDRGLKLDIYAEAGINDYWIFNLNECVLEAYSHPIQLSPNSIESRKFGYQQRRIYLSTETVAIPGYEDLQLELHDYFPK